MHPRNQSTIEYVIANRDILLCYFSLGFLLQLPVTVMRYFLVDECHLAADGLAEVAAVLSFPWAVKPLTAFLSEQFVSRFLARSRQIALAYFLAGLCWLSFLFFRGSLFLVLFYGFLSSFFSSFADVCQDACLIRRINRNETLHGRGRLQSFVLAFRSFGSLVGSFVSGGLALLHRPFFFIAILHLAGSLCGWRLKTLPFYRSGGDRSGGSDRNGGSDRSGGSNSGDSSGDSSGGGDTSLHKTTCGVCTEMCHAFLYAERWVFVLTLFILALPLTDFAVLQYYFQKGQQVKPITFAVTDAVSCIFMIAASLFFNYKLKGKNWKATIMLTQCIMMLIIASNLLLINRWIVVQAETYMVLKAVVGSFFGQLSFMPLAVKAADLCPENYEGTFYSLYMSTLNLGSVTSETITAEATRALEINAITGERTEIFYALVILTNIIALFLFHTIYRKQVN